MIRWILSLLFDKSKTRIPENAVYPDLSYRIPDEIRQKAKQIVEHDIAKSSTNIKHGNTKSRSSQDVSRVEDSGFHDF